MGSGSPWQVLSRVIRFALQKAQPGCLIEVTCGDGAWEGGRKAQTGGREKAGLEKGEKWPAQCHRDGEDHRRHSHGREITGLDRALVGGVRQREGSEVIPEFPV